MHVLFKRIIILQRESEAREISDLFQKKSRGRNRRSESLLKLFNGYVGVYTILSTSECLKFPTIKNKALSICSICFVKSQGFALDLAKANRSISYHYSPPGTLL